MTYTPINWQTGDTITAEKMNKMDNGWAIQEAQLFSETVTTTTEQDIPFANGILTYDSIIEAPNLIVTFDNSIYTVPLIQLPEIGNVYGEIVDNAPDFSTYPFCITSSDNVNEFFTETAGTYNITARGNIIEVSSDFINAVNTTISLPVFQLKSGFTTWQEVYDAIKSGKIVYSIIDNNDDETVTFCIALHTYVANDYTVVLLRYYSNEIDTFELSAETPNGVLSHK